MRYYTDEDAGSGQWGVCAICKLTPTPEGHDGCLGTLPGPIMNACCGHGRDSQAYIQYWPVGGAKCVIIDGREAIAEQGRLLEDCTDIVTI